MVLKECFGQLANLKIARNNSTRKHYLRVDDEKLKECDQCPLFSKCMFLRYNELMKELLQMIDEAGGQDQHPRL
ncbi:MAG: hypothetical protein QGD90_06415 [Candidatus Hydrogenedentes bacterium]|nr:hypothetical protein [Candidatus Hydrogenedentota bacterium]MDK1021253.1 hypothetical protein [Candidatus Hydrogenedentota bacterium]